MKKVINLLDIYTKTYPVLKKIEIEVIPYNNIFIAKCLVDPVGEYVNIKKGRTRDVIPRKILLTTVAMEKKEQEL